MIQKLKDKPKAKAKPNKKNVIKYSLRIQSTREIELPNGNTVSLRTFGNTL